MNISTNPPAGALRPLYIALLLIAVLAIALTAFFLGRRSAVPGSATTIIAAGEHAGEKAGEHAGEAEGEHAGEAEGEHAGEAEGEHGGLIKLDAAAAKTAGIRVQPARNIVLTETLAVPGTVEVSPNRTAKITPPVAGRVLSIAVSRGQSVRAGQVLAVLDSPEVAAAHAAVYQARSGVQQAQAGVQTAQAGVQQAQTRLGSARAALLRQRQLAETGTFAQPSLQAAQNELNAAESEEQQARTALLAAGTVLQRTERLFKEELVARAELEQARTAKQQEETRLAQTRKRAAIAQQAFEREQKVFQGGLLSKQAVQSAEADVRAAQSDLSQARKAEQAARTELAGSRTALAAAQSSLGAVEGIGHTGGGEGRIVLHAPIAGVVTERRATLGQAVERATELFEIENLNTVLVDAGVPEREVARVRVGQRVEVTVAAYPNARFPGVVQSLGSRVDDRTRTLPVRVLVQNPGGRLKPDMYARVTLSVGAAARSALAVPASAVAEEGDERFVFVQEDGGYERRDVTLGRASGEMVEVVKGVTAGEPVVTGGVFVLKSEGVKSELKGHDD